MSCVYFQRFDDGQVKFFFHLCNCSSFVEMFCKYIVLISGMQVSMSNVADHRSLSVLRTHAGEVSVICNINRLPESPIYKVKYGLRT